MADTGNVTPRHPVTPAPTPDGRPSEGTGRPRVRVTPAQGAALPQGRRPVAAVRRRGAVARVAPAPVVPRTVQTAGLVAGHAVHPVYWYLGLFCRAASQSRTTKTNFPFSETALFAVSEKPHTSFHTPSSRTSRDDQQSLRNPPSEQTP